jgi:TrfA protein
MASRVRTLLALATPKISTDGRVSAALKAQPPKSENHEERLSTRITNQFRFVDYMSNLGPLPADLAKSLQNLKQGMEARVAKENQDPRPTGKIVQFPLPFPNETPPVSNVIARSALFAAIKSKDRRQMKKEIVASQEGIEISFTGEQLNQDDHDNFMQLVKLASGRRLGQTVIVPANAILRTLGRSTGKSQHDQLRADMDRLVSGTVTIRANGFEYIGHLVDDALQDTREPVHKRHWAYRLNPRLVTLFAPNRYTLNNWETQSIMNVECTKFVKNANVGVIYG